MAVDDFEALKLKIRSDPKYGSLKAAVTVALQDVLEEEELKRVADGEKEEAEEGIIDSILGVFTDKKSKKK